MSEQDNLLNADGIEEKINDTSTENETVENVVTNTEDEEVINEIEESNAEDAEDESNSERHSIEEKDYQKFSLDQLVLELEKLVKNEKIQAIKKQVDGIKLEFDKKFNSLIEEKKGEFINYRQKISAHYKNLEKNLKGNLTTRLEIIENLKNLTNHPEDSMNVKYKQFKDLQEQWRNAGPIPRDKYNNAWNSYHFNVERFYDLLHLDR